MTFYLGNSYLYPITCPSLDVIRYHIHRQLSQQFGDYAFFTRFLFQIGSSENRFLRFFAVFCKSVPFPTAQFSKICAFSAKYMGQSLRSCAPFFQTLLKMYTKNFFYNNVSFR